MHITYQQGPQFLTYCRISSRAVKFVRYCKFLLNGPKAMGQGD